ncbi:MAG: dual specificity protein phosphatase family protein [Gemmataceae bacterium]|nr:dual specificity protein phosphatase family protein [Gemmataceae bacterium]
MRRVGDYPLWIGTARDARDIKRVLDAGIEAIVDLAMEEPPVVGTRELVCLRFPLTDDDGNAAWLVLAAVGAVAELVSAGVPTLVACGAGMSRSPTVAAAALAINETRLPADVLRALPGPVDVSRSAPKTPRRG